MEQYTKTIPFPVIQRLSQIFGVLTKFEDQGGGKRISSAELGAFIGQSAHTIRKDIHFCGVAGTAGAKYEVGSLKALIGEQLGFSIPKKCCIVGLGRLGTALLEHMLAIPEASCRLVAGFDSNVNRLETIQTTIPLFPAHRIEEIVRQMGIEMALLTVPPQQVQDVADRCGDGGITGLLNFTPVVVKPKSSAIFIRPMDVAGELRVLAAQAFTSRLN